MGVYKDISKFFSLGGQKTNLGPLSLCKWIYSCVCVCVCVCVSLCKWIYSSVCVCVCVCVKLSLKEDNGERPEQRNENN